MQHVIELYEQTLLGLLIKIIHFFNCVKAYFIFSLTELGKRNV